MINENSDLAFELEHALEQAEFNLHLMERYKDRILSILGEDIPSDLRNRLILSLMSSR
jgi:hypothetical protein